MSVLSIVVPQRELLFLSFVYTLKVILFSCNSVIYYSMSGIYVCLSNSVSYANKMSLCSCRPLLMLYVRRYLVISVVILCYFLLVKVHCMTKNDISHRRYKMCFHGM